MSTNANYHPQPQDPTTTRNNGNWSTIISLGTLAMPTHPIMPTPPMMPTTPTLQQANAILANFSTNGNRRNNRRCEAPPEPERPNMTQIYAENLLQKANYLEALIESKDYWKFPDIKEKRFARLDFATQHAMDMEDWCSTRMDLAAQHT